MKDDLFGFITRITEDPEANLRLAPYPVTKAKYRKAPVYDRNNKLITSEQEECNDSFENEEPVFLITSEQCNDLFENEDPEVLRILGELLKSISEKKESEEKEYIGKNTPDDSSP